MNTLKEILVDAARYRWLRENLWLVDEVGIIMDEGTGGMSGRYITAPEFDAEVDKELALGD